MFYVHTMLQQKFVVFPFPIRVFKMSDMLPIVDQN